MLSKAERICIHRSHLAWSVAETALLLACGVHLLAHCAFPFALAMSLSADLLHSCFCGSRPSESAGVGRLGKFGHTCSLMDHIQAKRGGVG